MTVISFDARGSSVVHKRDLKCLPICAEFKAKLYLSPIFRHHQSKKPKSVVCTAKAWVGSTG